MIRWVIKLGWTVMVLSSGLVNADELNDLARPYPPWLCRSCAEWNIPHEPFRIHGDSYYVGTEGLGAILITSPDGHVLIDGALPESAPLILKNIQALGFKPDDIVLILNSHVHYDHAGGIAAIQQVTGARVAASPKSAKVLERGRSGPVVLEAFERGFKNLEALPCDILITTHPVSSSMWARFNQGPDGLVDAQACRAYAENARSQLARRVSREQEGQDD